MLISRGNKIVLGETGQVARRKDKMTVENSRSHTENKSPESARRQCISGDYAWHSGSKMTLVFNTAVLNVSNALAHGKMLEQVLTLILITLFH